MYHQVEMIDYLKKEENVFDYKIKDFILPSASLIVLAFKEPIALLVRTGDLSDVSSVRY